MFPCLSLVILTQSLLHRSTLTDDTALTSATEFFPTIRTSCDCGLHELPAALAQGAAASASIADLTVLHYRVFLLGTDAENATVKVPSAARIASLLVLALQRSSEAAERWAAAAVC